MPEDKPEFTLDLSVVIKHMEAQQKEYFQLNKTIQEKTVYSTQIISNVFDIPMNDQLIFFRSMVSHLRVCEALCHKYAIGDTENP